MKEFPHLVQMQSTYGKNGLAAVSVSLDEVADRRKVFKFLEAKKATFTNLFLDEQPEVWQEKLDIDGPPTVFVFGRDGKLIKAFKDGFEYSAVEKLVVQNLNK